MQSSLPAAKSFSFFLSCDHFQRVHGNVSDHPAIMEDQFHYFIYALISLTTSWVYDLLSVTLIADCFRDVMMVFIYLSSLKLTFIQISGTKFLDLKQTPNNKVLPTLRMDAIPIRIL